MTLDELEILRTDVPLAGYPEGTVLPVRGLSFADFERLFAAFESEMETLFDRVSADGRMEASTIVQSLVTEFPLLSSHIIAVANDAPKSAEKASMLAIVNQTELLIEITKLTVHSAATVKKIVETITNGMEMATQRQKISSMPASLDGDRTKKAA